MKIKIIQRNYFNKYKIQNYKNKKINKLGIINHKI